MALVERTHQTEETRRNSWLASLRSTRGTRSCRPISGCASDSARLDLEEAVFRHLGHRVVSKRISCSFDTDEDVDGDRQGSQTPGSPRVGKIWLKHLAPLEPQSRPRSPINWWCLEICMTPTSRIKSNS